MSQDNSLVLSSLPPATAVPVTNFEWFRDQMHRASETFQKNNYNNTTDGNIRQAIRSAFIGLYIDLDDLRYIPLAQQQQDAGVARAKFINSMRGTLDLNASLTGGSRYRMPDLSEFIDFERDAPLPPAPSVTYTPTSPGVPPSTPSRARHDAVARAAPSSTGRLPPLSGTTSNSYPFTHPPLSRSGVAPPNRMAPLASLPKVGVSPLLNTNFSRLSQAQCMAMMRNLLTSFQTTDPIDRSKARYQEVLNAWNQAMADATAAAATASRTISDSEQAQNAATENCRVIFRNFVRLYNQHHAEVYGLTIGGGAPSLPAAVQRGRGSSASNALGLDGTADEDTTGATSGSEILSSLGQGFMNGPNATTPAIIEQQRDLEGMKTHYSEKRSGLFGPAPNPQRAHEASTTRHLPVEDTVPEAVKEVVKDGEKGIHEKEK